MGTKTEPLADAGKSLPDLVLGKLDPPLTIPYRDFETMVLRADCAKSFIDTDPFSQFLQLKHDQPELTDIIARHYPHVERNMYGPKNYVDLEPGNVDKCLREGLIGADPHTMTEVASAPMVSEDKGVVLMVSQARSGANGRSRKRFSGPSGRARRPVGASSENIGLGRHSSRTLAALLPRQPGRIDPSRHTPPSGPR